MPSIMFGSPALFLRNWLEVREGFCGDGQTLATTETPRQPLAPSHQLPPDRNERHLHG